MKFFKVLKKTVCILLLVLIASSSFGVAFGEESVYGAAPLSEEENQPAIGIHGSTGTDGDTGTNDNTGNIESIPSVNLENSSESETSNQGEAGIITGTNETNYNN